MEQRRQNSVSTENKVQYRTPLDPFLVSVLNRTSLWKLRVRYSRLPHDRILHGILPCSLRIEPVLPILLRSRREPWRRTSPCLLSGFGTLPWLREDLSKNEIFDSMGLFNARSGACSIQYLACGGNFSIAAAYAAKSGLNCVVLGRTDMSGWQM